MSGPAPQSEHFASRRDLCGAAPGPATVFLWTASRLSYSTRRNRLGRAGLCHRSIHSSWPIAKCRIRTSASVSQRRRKRLSHQGSRARSRGLRRSSAMRRHRNQLSRPRPHPSLPRVRRKRRQNETDIGRRSAAESDAPDLPTPLKPSLAMVGETGDLSCLLGVHLRRRALVGRGFFFF